MAASLPADEAARLEALRRYKILDTPPEQTYDDITLLAARICEAPIGLICFIDADRQWFKSRVGLDAPEPPLEASICAHVIRQSEVFIVRDARADERFATNPLVTAEPKIRFYAGMPLITPENHKVGALCVIDYVPRDLRPEQLETLRTLSRYVVTHLELRCQLAGRLRAEAALRANEEELRGLFENVPTGLYRTAPDGRILMANAALIRMLGYSSFEELASRSLEKTGSGTPFMRGQFKRLVEQEGEVRGLESVWAKRDHSLVFVRESARAIRREDGTVAYYEGAVEDVSDRTRAAETRLRGIVQSAIDAIICIDAEGIITEWNPQAESIFGWARWEALGQNIAATIIPPHYREGYRRGLQHFLATGEGPFLRRLIELTAQHRDGHEFPVELTVVPAQSGETWTFTAFVRDITERTRAAEALRESEERHRLMLESSPDPIVVYDAQGNVTYANPPFVQTFGWSRDELLGKRIDFIPDEHWPETNEAVERLRRGQVVSLLETGRLTKDNRILNIQLSASPLMDKEGRFGGAIVILRDITERRHLEAQLRQAQRLEAIGRLAGGIAHDFNNLLNGIIGFTELALRELPEGAKGRQYLSRVLGVGSQAADLIGQLMTFAREAPLERNLLDLNQVFRETGKLLERTFPETLVIQVELTPEPVIVEADLGQVQQILLNLATNARDAMPQGGILTLRLAPVTLTEENLGSHSERRPGTFACLTVADTGIGLAPAIRDRIFEPFFTTKEAGQGTGLGLASVYGAVHQHEGWLELETAEEQGTAVRVFLPLLPRASRVASEPAATLPRGTETVLLVEDNPMVREVGETLLTELGYTVRAAGDGVEALATFRAHPGIALVLTDAIMPRMGAADLVPALRAEAPGVKVLIFTGYAPETVQASLRHLNVSAYIQKPFRQADLAIAVRSALDGPLPRVA